MRRNGRDAPIPDLRGLTPETERFDPKAAVVMSLASIQVFVHPDPASQSAFEHSTQKLRGLSGLTLLLERDSRSGPRRRLRETWIWAANLDRGR
jgi:hypothetical protein